MACFSLAACPSLFGDSGAGDLVVAVVLVLQRFECLRSCPFQVARSLYDHLPRSFAGPRHESNVRAERESGRSDDAPDLPGETCETSETYESHET